MEFKKVTQILLINNPLKKGPVKCGIISNTLIFATYNTF